MPAADCWLLLGASRGLGRSFFDLLKDDPSNKIVSVSRKEFSCDQWLKMDFSKVEEWPQFIKSLQDCKPTRLVYFAGGGPHGQFSSQKFKSHQWAFRVNFEFPAFLLHSILSHNADFNQLKQLCFIGSSIAENQPDPLASSYAAAKHALRGLVTSVQAELKLNPKILDLQLYSPGYMQTDLLPEGSWPRSQGLAQPPELVAADLLLVLESTLI